MKEYALQIEGLMKSLMAHKEKLGSIAEAVDTMGQPNAKEYWKYCEISNYLSSAEEHLDNCISELSEMFGNSSINEM